MEYNKNNPVNSPENSSHPNSSSHSVPVPVITIDGPSGSGKGTISLLLAKALGWHFLDSGAVYRVLAWAALEYGLDLTQEEALEELALKLNVQFNDQILCDGKDISHQIRSESCGNTASKIAIFPKVRAALLVRQRAFRTSPGLVADGRDMGTIVFPDAELKFFLVASPEERAVRRYLQLKDTAYNVTLESLLTEIEERDRRDTERAVAPLKAAEGAVVIDTTGVGIEGVFGQVMVEVKQRFY